MTPYPAVFMHPCVCLSLLCTVPTKSAQCKVQQPKVERQGAFKQKQTRQLCLFRKLEISAAVEITEKCLAVINNTWEPPFKTSYGNCLKSEQPISKRHMFILKICAGAGEKLSALTEEKAPTVWALILCSVFFLYVDVIDSMSTTDGLLLE